MVDVDDDPIELVSSNYEEWCEQFTGERDRIRTALSTHALDAHIERIEHVGSTAVPDLAAKDIVDLDIIVNDGTVSDVSLALEAEWGGKRVKNSDQWQPVFRVENGQRFNDHVFAVSSDRWKISVVTRDVLRMYPDLCREYEELKRDLSDTHDDLSAYSKGKTQFMRRVLDTARKEDLPYEFTVPSL
ncbi:GrpB family protein [Halocatena marina]|uniref:GrpB family protein n=1 Tax=Halocatena marina TaxID=2934937 RepID=UPI00200F1414|nr:GrpB family protein [Halocatena marina]